MVPYPSTRSQEGGEVPVHHPRSDPLEGSSPSVSGPGTDTGEEPYKVYEPGRPGLGVVEVDEVPEVETDVPAPR